MKCFGILEPGKTVGWFEKPEPECGPLDALVKPVALSPCTSDVHNAFRIGNVGFLKNRVLGHESVGIVQRVGDQVRDFRPGDRVVVPAITPDWRNVEAQGKLHQHIGRISGSFQFAFHIDGVFSQMFRVPDADMNLARLPDGISLETAVMITDMMSTGFHGAELADIQFGDDVAVMGVGPVGLMAVAGAVLRGAARVIVVDNRKNCVELAMRFGATDVINYQEGDVARQIKDLTNRAGVNKVIVAGGGNEAFQEAVKAVKAGGTIANVSFFAGVDNLFIPNLAWGSGMAHKTIVGGLTPGGRLRMEKLLSMALAGRANPGLLITHRFYAFEDVEKAFWLMVDKPADLIKPIVLLG